ncbi:MAG: hypothetical protein ACI311_07595 [Bacilli bacterium]
MQYQLFIVKDEFKDVINENLIRLLTSLTSDQFYETQYNQIFGYLTLNSIKEDLIKYGNSKDLKFLDDKIIFKTPFMDEYDVIFKKDEKIFIKMNDDSSFLKKLIINSVKNIKFVKI